MTQSTQDWAVSEQQGFLSRIGGWFKRGQRDGDTLLTLDDVSLDAPSQDTEESHDPADDAADVDSVFTEPAETGDDETLADESDERQAELPLALASTVVEPRSTFLRPWARRDAAIENLQNGLVALSDLMGSIRSNLERQSNRQDEVLHYLSNLSTLPQALQESSRVQGEALQAINHQIERQNAQQTKLGDILERISDADNQQRRTLDALQDRVETMTQHDQAIAMNLYTVGSALEGVSRNSQTSAEVLGQMRDNQNTRDGQLERILHRQGNRFTTMLAVAIFLSIAALVAVAVIGYLGYEALSKVH